MTERLRVLIHHVWPATHYRKVVALSMNEEIDAFFECALCRRTTEWEVRVDASPDPSTVLLVCAACSSSLLPTHVPFAPDA